MGQAHLYALHPQFSFRFHKNIPFWIREKICHCEFFNYGGIKKDPYNQIHRCDTCGKYNVYLLFKCVDCEEHFIKDFRHPRFCTFEHFRCWDCLNVYLELDELCCDRVRWYIDNRKAIVPPVGISVRRLSEQEMNDILGDEFNFEIT